MLKANSDGNKVLVRWSDRPVDVLLRKAELPCEHVVEPLVDGIARHLEEVDNWRLPSPFPLLGGIADEPRGADPGA